MRALSESEFNGQLPGAGEWLWLHLNFADWRCRRWLAQTFDFPSELVNEICDPPLRQHVSARESVLFGHLADFRSEFDSDSTEFGWLHFALGERFLITGRVRPVQSAERLRQVTGAGYNFTNPASLLSHLLSLYTDVVDMALHRLSDELEIIEDHVLYEHHRGERKRLMLTRRDIAQQHRWPDRHFVPDAVRDHCMFSAPSSTGGGAMVTGAAAWLTSEVTSKFSRIEH